MNKQKYVKLCDPRYDNFFFFFVISKCFKNEQTHFKHCNLLYDNFILIFHYVLEINPYI